LAHDTSPQSFTLISAASTYLQRQQSQMLRQQLLLCTLSSSNKGPPSERFEDTITIPVIPVDCASRHYDLDFIKPANQTRQDWSGHLQLVFDSFVQTDRRPNLLASVQLLWEER